MSLLIPTGAVAVVLLSGGAAAAQTPQTVPPAQTENLVVTAMPRSSPTHADFGLKKAQKTLPAGQWRLVEPRSQQITPFSAEPLLTVTPAESLTATPAEPMDCKMVKSHRDDLFPAIKVITPKAGVKHHIKAITVPSCPGR